MGFLSYIKDPREIIIKLANLINATKKLAAANEQIIQLQEEKLNSQEKIKDLGHRSREIPPPPSSRHL